MAKIVWPIIWLKRCTGAMKVYSMVPSHRSQAIISLMLLKMLARNRHTRVPISR